VHLSAPYSDDYDQDSAFMFKTSFDADLEPFFSLGAYARYAPFRIPELGAEGTTLEFGMGVRSKVALGEVIVFRPGVELGYRSYRERGEFDESLSGVALNVSLEIDFTGDRAWAPFGEVGILSHPRGGDGGPHFTYGPIFYALAGLSIGWGGSGEAFAPLPPPSPPAPPISAPSPREPAPPPTPRPEPRPTPAVPQPEPTPVPPAPLPPSAGAPERPWPLPSAPSGPDESLARGELALRQGDYAEASEAFRDYLEAVALNRYTIAVALYCDASNLARQIGGLGDTQGLFVLRVSPRGQPCWGLYWGIFLSEEVARDTLGHVPPALRAPGQAPIAVSRLLASSH
jgi:hypothetical protein